MEEPGAEEGLCENYEVADVSSSFQAWQQSSTYDLAGSILTQIKEEFGDCDQGHKEKGIEHSNQAHRDMKMCALGGF